MRTMVFGHGCGEYDFNDAWMVISDDMKRSWGRKCLVFCSFLASHLRQPCNYFLRSHFDESEMIENIDVIDLLGILSIRLG